MLLIREAVETDLFACLNLFEVGRNEHPAGYDGLVPEMVDADIAHSRVLVAEENNRVVGMVSSIPTPKTTMLYMLVVDKNHRGQSLAPELIKAANMKFGKVSSIIAPHALKSFEKAGMKHIAHYVESHNDS